MHLGFIGTGRLAAPMIENLLADGHRVTVYNRSPAKAAKWLEEFSGKAADTPAEAARGARFVFACVGNDDDVRAVTTGENGAFHGMASGAVFVDHTTASAEVARFPLVGQIIEPGREFYPSTTSVRAEAIDNRNEIAFRIRWNDMRAEQAGTNSPLLEVPMFVEPEAAVGGGDGEDEGGFWGDEEMAEALALPKLFFQ